LRYKKRSLKRCPLCGEEMKATGYIQFIDGMETKWIPTKWKCTQCGLVLDAM